MAKKAWAVEDAGVPPASRGRQAARALSAPPASQGFLAAPSIPAVQDHVDLQALRVIQELKVLRARDQQEGWAGGLGSSLGQTACKDPTGVGVHRGQWAPEACEVS